MSIEQNYNRSELAIGELLKQKRILEEQLKEIDSKISILQSKGSSSSLVKDENKIESKEVKFFRDKVNKVLQGELPNSYDARFKVFNIKNYEAEFAYCGKPINENYFEGVADIINNVNDNLSNKTEIVTVAPGILEKDFNNNWKVKKIMKIEYK